MAFYRASIGGGGGGGGRSATGSFITNTSATSGYKVVTGFRPKYISVFRSNSTNPSAAIYNYDINPNQFFKALPSSCAWRNFESANFMSLVSVDNDGFTFWTNSSYSSYTWDYWASE